MRRAQIVVPKSISTPGKPPVQRSLLKCDVLGAAASRPRRGGRHTSSAEFLTLVYPFLYNSSQQVLKYVRYRRHPISKHWKTGHDCADADAIEELLKRYPDDPLYPHLIEARQKRKLISTYIDGYEPEHDGRVRPSFTFKPSTGRLACEHPNLQNTPKRGKLANTYRNQFVAGMGCVLVEFDYKAIEAVIVGLLAGDQDYTQATRVGIHAILASHILNDPIDPNALDATERVALIKRDHKELYAQAKMVCHASNYLGSAYRLRVANPDIFKRVKDAANIQDIYFNTIGKGIRKLQNDTLHEAHTKTYLDTVFGHRHYFWDVFHYDARKGTMVWGNDAKRAVAFRPSSIAASVIKHAMLELNDDVFRYCSLQIHDALVFEFPEDDQLCDRILYVKEIMERERRDVQVDVEVSIGKRWGEMERWTL